MTLLIKCRAYYSSGLHLVHSCILRIPECLDTSVPRYYVRLVVYSLQNIIIARFVRSRYRAVPGYTYSGFSILLCITISLVACALHSQLWYPPWGEARWLCKRSPSTLESSALAYGTSETHQLRSPHDPVVGMEQNSSSRATQVAEWQLLLATEETLNRSYSPGV